MGNSKCSCIDCELEVYEDNDKCVLHCEKKKDYQHTDWNLYKKFEKELILNIAKQLKDDGTDSFELNDESAIGVINDKFLDESKEDINHNLIIFDQIVFPQGKSQDSFFYNKVIKKLRAIHFNYCEFNVRYLELDNIQCFFQDCIFHTSWTLPNCSILENEDNVIYQTSIFQGDVSNYTPEDNKELAVYQASQFDYTCQFKKNIDFHRVRFENMLFNTNQNNSLEENSIKKLSLDSCTFDAKFKLNNYSCDEFILNDSLFNSKFDDFVGFENCNFGSIENLEKDIAVFRYTTFRDFINFRNTTFLSGLDIQTANFKEAPNFFAVNISFKNTNRETFRIIKYSFDKIGNITEANKIFAYEMKKERDNTLLKNNPNKKIILNLNYWISNFGQSWLKPLGLILFVAILHTLLIYTIDSKIFQVINPSNSIYDTLKWLVGFSNNLAKNILPFKKPLIEGKEFISLIFLIIYSTLIYNFIVAVKRITKR